MKKSVWGWLFPLKDEFTSLDLKKDEYIVGKDPNCSYVITETHFNRIDYTALPKRQFKILKKKDGVYIEDIGGTYVNNKEVGVGKKIVLNHNDCIAVARIYNRVFVYLEKKQAETSSSQLPDEIAEKYHLSYKLGEGGFGEVSLVFEKETGKRFAMKTVKKKPSIKKYTSTEAEILRKIQHPCIIMTKEVVDRVSALFIVMEMMDGGDLQHRMKPVAEREMKLIFFQLVQAIECLHKHNIVHRDIKPENVLLTSRNTEPLVKVTDFGVSKILRPGTVMNTHVGTPMYVAPEIKSNPQRYTNVVDVWSMGVLLYYCLSGILPFDKELTRYVLMFPNYKWSSVSNSAILLIKAMLQVNPPQRIGIDGILAHSWLQDDKMRQKAHKLMWPDKPYVAPVAPAPITPRKFSLPEQSNRRREVRGVLNYMKSNPKPGGALDQLQLRNANVNYQPLKLSNPSPGQPILNYLEKPSVSPKERKPIGNFDVKPNVPSHGRIQNALPLQQRYEVNNGKPVLQPRPYVSPLNVPQSKPYLSPFEVSQPKPYVSPFEKKSLLSSPQAKPVPNIERRSPGFLNDAKYPSKPFEYNKK